MILYLGASLYHILCFSVHKIMYHPEEEAMLVVGDHIFSKNGMNELKQDIMEAGIFQRMEILHFIEGAYRNPVHLDETSTKKEVEAYVKENNTWVENWLCKKNIHMKDMSKIYSAGDHRHLGLYVLSKKIPYAYFEDGNGLLSREHVQIDFYKSAQYESYAIYKHYKALGNHPCVVKKYANMTAQLPGFYDERAEDFPVIPLFVTLSKENQQRIFKMFHLNEMLDFHGESPVLFLTRYAEYMKNPTIDRHHFMATILTDIFCNESPLVLKVHPRDFSGRYAQIFPNAKIMARQFPSELLPFVTKERYQKVITVGSTAIDALAKETGEIIKLGEAFEDKLDEIYSYVGMMMTIQRVTSDLKEGDVGYKGPLLEFVNPLAMEYLKIHVEEAQENKSYKVLWLDEKNFNRYEGDIICSFSPMYLDEIIEDTMSYIKITSEKTEVDSFGYEGNEVLCLSSKEPKTNEALKTWRTTKTFTNTKSKLYIETMNENEQEFQRVHDKILQLRNNIDFPDMHEDITQADIEAMKYLKEMLEK